MLVLYLRFGYIACLVMKIQASLTARGQSAKSIVTGKDCIEHTVLSDMTHKHETDVANKQTDFQS